MFKATRSLFCTSRTDSQRISPAVKGIDWEKIAQPRTPFQQYSGRRSVVYGTKGMVACSQPLAAEAGLEILRKGGNAADASVAVSAALNVTEPGSCGLGGDGFCLFYDARSRKVKGLNGSGRSPEKLTIDYVRRRGITGTRIPSRDLNSVTVPGCVALWVDTLDAFGTLKIADVLEPAIELAEGGVPVSEIHSGVWQRSEKTIKEASPNGNEILLNGRAPLPGQLMKFPTLAQSFREIATHGKGGFYRGRIAEEIVKLVKSKGGVMELEDLAKHATDFVEPMRYTYNGEVTVYECPPNGQGITALIALGILEQLEARGLVRPLREMAHNSAEYLHTLIESLRLAFADASWYVSDPDRGGPPTQELLREEYLDQRAKLFDPSRANLFDHGNPVTFSDTVYFAVTDKWGNACSFIQSIYSDFGTGAVPRGCGFTLQNRGSCFVLEEGHPNALEGGKRPYHTIIPALVTRNDELLMTYGVMGGFMQPQGHVQVLLNILHGLNVQAALDAPRFCIDAKPNGYKGSLSKVFLEEGISPEVVDELRRLGHHAVYLTGSSRAQFGRGQIIQKKPDPSGRLVWAAGSDPRADGHAVPQI
ncbi:gamma-glutamyltranspeptidase [Thelephora terrestris]|uniref:Gamma-glutamyltranspeptidase n=1 Tax=Thelephora terrestris TaxID=56493 RepID=A0A9P6HHC0_9AGAM|nr:gamma-glutamyltranspeptidase [Thelephora terrestris]